MYTWTAEGTLKCLIAADECLQYSYIVAATVLPFLLLSVSHSLWQSLSEVSGPCHCAVHKVPVICEQMARQMEALSLTTVPAICVLLDTLH